MLPRFKQKALDEILGDLKTDGSGYLQRACNHKIIQFLDFKEIGRIKNIKIDAIQKEVTRITTQCFAYYQVRGKNFLSLHKLLSEAQIDFILVKGLDVASRYYEKPWLRSFGDTDILIRGSHLLSVYERFTASGFNIERVSAKKHTHNRILTIIEHCARAGEALTFNRGKECVDVHPIEETEFDYLLKLAEKTEIFGQEYLALPRLQNLELLLRHGEKHNWHILQWSVDIFLILKDLSESELLECYTYCKGKNLGKSFKICLYLFQYLFEFELPKNLNKELSDKERDSKLFSFIKEQLTSRDHSLKRKLFNLRTQIKLKSGFLDKLIVIYRKFFSPTLTDFTWIVVPRCLYWSYFLIRPVRGLLSNRKG
jgi:hypothetical protein